MMTKGRTFLIGILICLVMVLLAGCETSFPEWSGDMPNQSGTHQQPNADQQSSDNQAIRPAAWLSNAGDLISAAHRRKVSAGSQAVAHEAAGSHVFTAILKASAVAAGSSRSPSHFTAASMPGWAP